MSALSPKADIGTQRPHVRYRSSTDIAAKVDAATWNSLGTAEVEALASYLSFVK